jgi:hypothetical protein
LRPREIEDYNRPSVLAKYNSVKYIPSRIGLSINFHDLFNCDWQKAQGIRYRIRAPGIRGKARQQEEFKMSQAKRFLTWTVVAFALVFGVISASAQTFVEYTAKFTCGTATATSTPMVQPGTYSTSINIHNPHDDIFSSQKSTSFAKKVVLSLPEGTAFVQPSAFVSDTLPNDFAEEVDCKIIRTMLGSSAPPPPAFIEGYVVIIVPPTTSPTGTFTNELDVIGIYTDLKGALVVRPANVHFVAPGTT